MFTLSPSFLSEPFRTLSAFHASSLVLEEIFLFAAYQFFTTHGAFLFRWHPREFCRSFHHLLVIVLHLHDESGWDACPHLTIGDMLGDDASCTHHRVAPYRTVGHQEGMRPDKAVFKEFDAPHLVDFVPLQSMSLADAMHAHVVGDKLHTSRTHGIVVNTDEIRLSAKSNCVQLHTLTEKIKLASHQLGSLSGTGSPDFQPKPVFFNEGYYPPNLGNTLIINYIIFKESNRRTGDNPFYPCYPCSHKNTSSVLLSVESVYRLA